MQYIKWLLEKRFEMVMALVALIAFLAGAVVCAVTCADLDKQHQEAVQAGVIETPERAPQTAEEVSPAQESAYFDVPLSEDLQNHIFAECENKGVAPTIVLAMCYRESNYNASAVGDDCHSYGLMQIQKRWHTQRMQRLGATDLLDPYQNITVGVDYLAELLCRYDHDVEKALTAYNRGHYSGTVTEYAKAVLKTAYELAPEFHTGT